MPKHKSRERLAGKQKGKKKTLPKTDPFELMTCFEECISEALTLNSALMVLMDNPRFSELNFEILLQISYRLRQAKERLPEGYQLKLR